MKTNSRKAAPKNRKRVNIELDLKEYQQLADYAEADFRSITDLIRLALSEYIKAHPLKK